jgi:hypothetical protein
MPSKKVGPHKSKTKQPRQRKSKQQSKKNESHLTEYEKCKQSLIRKEMGRFKKGKLKQRNKDGPVVKSPKQAIAIAINYAERNCKNKMGKKDHAIMKDKMQQNLHKKKYKEPITIIDVKRGIQLMRKYKEQKKYTQLRHLQRDLMAKILMTLPTKQGDAPVPKIILREIQNYIKNYYK